MTNHYTDVCEKEIESLRQQLAELKSELKAIGKAIDDPRTDLTMTMSEVIIDQKQQLHAAQADNIRLREALDYVVLQIPEFASVPGIAEALAATADLSGLVLCDAEPAGYEVETMDKKKMLMRVACYLVGHRSEPLYKVRKQP